MSMYKTGEIYDVIDTFKKTFNKENSKMEGKEMWVRQIYFCNGDDNNLFIAFFGGYALAKSKFNVSDE